MNDDPRYHELELKRIRIQRELKPIESAIASCRKELENLEAQSAPLTSQLLAVRQGIHNLYRSNGQIVPMAHLVPELPSTPLGPPSSGPRNAEQRSISLGLAGRVLTQSYSANVSLQIAANAVDLSQEFPFAGYPPSWDTISQSANDEEPIGKQDEVLVKANPVMLCDDLKCIVLLGTDWTLIWCPVCGANCVDDQFEPNYFAGMAGLRRHITKSHAGLCSGAYQKFIVDHGGSQSLGEDVLADVRSRRFRPQFRAAFRADVGIERPEAGVEEMSSDDNNANEEPDERVPKGRDRPLFRQDATRSSQEDADRDQAETEESEPAHATQHDHIDQPVTRPARSTHSTRKIVGNPRRSASTLGSLDEGPVTAMQKKARRRNQSTETKEFGKAPAESAKMRSKSLVPGTYDLSRENYYEWEDREEGEAS